MNRIIADKITKKFNLGYRKNEGALGRFVLLFKKGSKRSLTALNGVSLKVKEGEVIGIIGSNGAGKSTLLRIIAGIYAPDSGRIEINGKIISLINLGFGFRHRLTMRDNIYLCCSLFDMGLKTIEKRFDSIAKFAELEDYADNKLYQFSNGMIQRLAFSIAIHCDPEILLLDEVFEVGDTSFKKKSGRKIQELVKGGCSVVFVSHDMAMIKKHCGRVLRLEKGKISKVSKSKI